MIRHLPNLLSALRLAAAPLAAWAIIVGHDTLGLCVFAGASASDALDGFVARRWGLTSRSGALIDPAADKLLMLLCYAALWRIGAAPLWLVAVVVARDGAIALGWLTLRFFSLPIRFEPLAIGKASTLVQIAYVGFWLLLLAFDWDAPHLATAAAWTTAVFTVFSGLAYGQVLLRGLFAGHRIA